jgi:16S rRNA (cytosine1402-N4)-methyltransferase
MRAGNFDGTPVKDFYGRVEAPLEVFNNKPIVPDAAEQEQNTRSRSAKLRCAIKL